jgi:hypothetical protein
MLWAKLMRKISSEDGEERENEKKVANRYAKITRGTNAAWSS